MNESNTWRTSSSHQYESPLAQPFISVFLKETGLKRHYSNALHGGEVGGGGGI